MKCISLKTLDQKGVEYAIYDGIKPDPTYDQVEEDYSLLQQNDCEAILTVGGGSPIDAAKVIIAIETNKKSINKLAGWFKVRKSCLPRPIKSENGEIQQSFKL